MSLPVTFSETVLDAAGPKGPLKGTLLTPNSKPNTVVLIVPGSGPTDRDGNNPLGVNASPYRLLAEGLAAKGLATLRIDKRGMFASAMAVEDGVRLENGNYPTLRLYFVQHWRRMRDQQFINRDSFLLKRLNGSFYINRIPECYRRRM